MHTILLHITGVAIIEICFFFYYVGPMETQLFQKTVRILAKDPVEELNDLFLTNPTTYPNKQLILKLFSIQSDTDNMETEMQNINNSGKTKREKQNQLLFTKSLIWWSILFTISIIIFGLYYYFNRNNTLTSIDNNTETDGSHFLGIELSNDEDTIERYRKTSYDYADDQTLFPSKKSKAIILCNLLSCSPIRRKKCLTTTKYFMFGICIVLFQFIFFKNIVMFYDPLSIDEMKYIIYSITRSTLNT